jgi:15-cis-phytoene synthase
VPTRQWGDATKKIKTLLWYEGERARAHYAAAAPGIAMLSPPSRGCIAAAYRLYAGILDEVARAGCDVFAGRVVVSRPRRLMLATRGFVGASLGRL